jgi:hypothetical protein
VIAALPVGEQWVTAERERRTRHWTGEHTFDTVGPVRYEVDVTIHQPLDDRTERFLEAARRSANRLIRFTGGGESIRLTVEVAGMCREDAIRSAAREVAAIFPACDSERYGEPRLV